MKVSEVMTHGVESVSPAATLEQAAKKMRTRNVGFLPVIDGERVIGVVTDRDIVLRAVSEGMRPHMTTVREVMTAKPICCYDDQSITEVSLMMERNLVRRVVVVDRKEKALIGIITLSDIAAKLRDERLSGHVLNKVSVA
jgi:CBS domain-containing protein